MISALSASSFTAYASPASDGSATTRRSGARASQAQSELSDEQKRQLQKLAETDAKVRTHEAAHMAAAGGLAIGGASFGYESGPDGKRYAVSGEVQISISKGRTPEETLSRAEQIRRAALAPADPSSQDQQVAAEASQMATEARAEMATQALQSSYGTGSSTKGSVVNAQA